MQKFFDRTGKCRVQCRLALHPFLRCGAMVQCQAALHPTLASQRDLVLCLIHNFRNRRSELSKKGNRGVNVLTIDWPKFNPAIGGIDICLVSNPISKIDNPFEFGFCSRSRTAKRVRDFVPRVIDKNTQALGQLIRCNKRLI